MSRRFLQRGATILCIVGGLVVLSASRDSSFQAVEQDSPEASQQHATALLDIATPFEESVECYVNGEQHVLVVHRRIRLFFFPASPRAGPVDRAEIAEECH